MKTSCTSPCMPPNPPDRKSTRLNSSHGSISYAVFCLKKKNHAEYSLHTATWTRYALQLKPVRQPLCVYHHTFDYNSCLLFSSVRLLLLVLLVGLVVRC